MLAERGEQALYLRCAFRRTEKITLDVSTSLSSQDIELILRFDPFSGRDNVETTAKANNRAKNGQTLLGQGQIADEGLVNLDPIEWKAAEISEQTAGGLPYLLPQIA